jgi:2-iminobutanoate/2-iminopropanoate deaminase
LWSYSLKATGKLRRENIQRRSVMKRFLSAVSVCISILLAVVVFAQEGNKTDVKVEYYKTPRPMDLPFSDAVRVGNILYLSGEIGVDYSTMKVVPGGIQAETKQCLDNIKTTLEKYGSSMDRVFKCTVMIDDMKEWPLMNQVYVTYFQKDRLPARSAIGADGLALGAKVEIECLATVD